MKRPSAMNSVGAVSAIVIPMLAVVILGFAWGENLRAASSHSSPVAGGIHTGSSASR